MKAFWLQSFNVGDALTPFLLRGLFGVEPVNVRDGRGRWFMGGSILHYARRLDILCGCGGIAEGAVPTRTTLIALRGPRTAKRMMASGCLYGDAGLMLPAVYTPKPADRHVLGIIPHYVDAHLTTGTDVIPVSLGVPDFIDRVTSCEAVASSSLHGIVIAEAYGIPAVRIRFPTSDGIRDFDYKHADYYEGTGRELPAAVTLESAIHGDFERKAPDLSSITKALTDAARCHTV